MKRPAPLKLFLQRMAKESPSVIQQNHDTECKVKIGVAWIFGWVFSDLLLYEFRMWDSGFAFPDWYQTDIEFERENSRCLDSWVGALRFVSICVSDLRFWIGASRPIAHRYRIQSKNCCLRIHISHMGCGKVPDSDRYETDMKPRPNVTFPV